MPDQANSSWIKPVLAEHLGRVDAPAGLWTGPQYARRTKAGALSWLAWAAVATMFLLGVVLGGHSYVRHAMTLQAVSANPVRHNAAQTGVRFAMQVACQACHSSGEL